MYTSKAYPQNSTSTNPDTVNFPKVHSGAIPQTHQNLKLLDLTFHIQTVVWNPIFKYGTRDQAFNIQYIGNMLANFWFDLLKYLRKQRREGSLYSDSLVESTIHNKERMETGIWGSWSQCSHNHEGYRGIKVLLTFFFILGLQIFTFRMGVHTFPLITPIDNHRI